MAFLTDGTISVEGDGHSHEPWGFLGGADGRTSELHLVHADGKTKPLPSMLASLPVLEGDRIRAVRRSLVAATDPAFERSPELGARRRAGLVT
jgi:N-methylhydantoinase B